LRGESLSVYGDGLQSRSFTYVSDAIRATVLAGERKQALGEAFNIGSLNEITIIDAAKLVLALTGSASAIHYQEYKEIFGPRFEDTRRRVPDIRKASDVLGFKAEIALEDGIRQTATWWSSVLTSGWGNQS
jgi:UDP-glucose 4-epimerase